MTYPHGGASQIWRDGDGGSHNPEKGQIRDWGKQIEQESILARDVPSLDGRVGALEAVSLGGAALYADTAAGIAATSDGDFFNTPSALPNGYADLYKNVAGVAVFQSTLASRSAYETLRAELSEASLLGYQATTIPAGSGAVDGSNYVFADAVGTDGKATKLRVYAAAAGTLNLRVWTRVGDVFTMRAEEAVSVVLGYQEIVLSIAVAAGEYLGFQGAGIVSTKGETADGAGWYAGAGTSFTDATPSTNIRLFASFELEQITRLTKIEGDLSDVQARTGETQIERIGHLGTIPSSGSSIDNSLYALEQAVSHAGTVTKLRCFTVAADDVRVMVFSKSGDVFTVEQEQTVSASGGFEEIAVSLPVQAGQYLGVQSTEIGFRSGVADTFGWYGAGGTNSFTDASPSRTSRVLVGFEISYDAPPVFTPARPKGFDLPFKSSMVLAVGQSLWEGSDGVVTTTGELGVKGFAAYPAAPDAIYDASVENTERATNRGEWPVLSAAAAIQLAMKRDHGFDMALDNTIVVANTAVSGARLDEISQGTAPFSAGVAMAAALEGITGEASGVLGVSFGQGESGNDPTGEAAYLAGLIQLAEDLDADLRAATGQDRRVPLFTYQMNSKINFVGKMHLQASLDSPLIYCVGPMYQYTYYDTLHINAASARLVGALHGEAMKAVCIDGGPWEPLRPVDAKVLGNTVTLTFNKSGLVFDTTTLPSQTNQGFVVTDAADTAISVSAVELLNGNQVRLTCASAPQPDWTVSYGVAAVGRADSFIGSMGNLRDNAGLERQFDSVPLHNWCVVFDWVL